jgi:hypothetical protein
VLQSGSLGAVAAAWGELWLHTHAHRAASDAVCLPALSALRDPVRRRGLPLSVPSSAASSSAAAAAAAASSASSASCGCKEDSKSGQGHQGTAQHSRASLDMCGASHTRLHTCFQDQATQHSIQHTTSKALGVAQTDVQTPPSGHKHTP